MTTQTINPAVVIDGTLYVVTDSVMSGSANYKTLVGPNGGVFTLATYGSGKRELMNKSMRTIWNG